MRKGRSDRGPPGRARRGPTIANRIPPGFFRRRARAVVRGVVETWVRDGVGDPGPARPGASAPVRRLDEADASAFAASSPGWALRGWGSFPALVRDGAAFAVPARDGRFAALA